MKLQAKAFFVLTPKMRLPVTSRKIVVFPFFFSLAISMTFYLINAHQNDFLSLKSWPERAFSFDMAIAKT